MLDSFLQTFKNKRIFWQKIHQSPKALSLTVVVVTFALIMVFKFVQPKPPVKPQQEKTWVVQTITLSAGAKSPEIELYGHVESPYTASLSSRITADIKTLDVREGQYVKQGQQLILLDDTDARLVLEDKQSNVTELEALITSENNRYKNDLASLKLEKSLVALAEKKLAREEKTSKTNLTSRSSFDSQKQALQNHRLALNARKLSVTDHHARLAQLKAKLNRSRALAEQAELDLIRTKVIAPFDGVILKIRVSPGERIRASEVLLETYASDQIELRAQLPQKFVPTIRQVLLNGTLLQAILQTDTGQHRVTLSRISGLLTDSGSGVDALFTADSQTTDALIMGETLVLVLQLPPVNGVYSIPVSSIYGSNRIYRVENQRLVAIKVSKQGYQYRNNRQFVLVSSKQLKPQDEIIITQLPHAVNGLKVDVHNPAAEKSPLGSLVNDVSELSL